jgi:selenocysteine-specific elongation factor
VDRSFTLRGIGTVVTGTLWSGSLQAGEAVRLLPAGREARIRSVQVHDQEVARAEAGQRVALNLGGVGWRQIARGDVVCGPGCRLEPTYLLDAALTLERMSRPLHRGTRVQVHHGTREAPARLVRLDGDDVHSGEPALAQLRLEAPLMPQRDDRLVVRQIAPPDTIGGGLVLDARPRKHGGDAELVARLRALEAGDVTPPPARPSAAGLGSAAPPARSSEPKLAPAALGLAKLLLAAGPTPPADGDLAAAAGLEPAVAAAHLRALVRAGLAVRVAANLHYAPGALAELRERVVELCERDGAVTVAGLRDALGSSRRYAQALLEHLDAEEVTVRRGDEHVLRRRGS